MKKYYFIDRIIETKEIVDLRIYNVDKTQSEINELIAKYNDPKSGPREHIPVHQSLMREVIDLALEWRSRKKVDNILENLSYIENDISNIRIDIQEYFDSVKTDR